MTNMKHAVLGVMATAALLAQAAAPALAETTDGAGSVQGTSIDTATAASTDVLTIEDVEADASVGEFTWNQSALTPNPVIKNVFATASNSLCNATTDFAEINPLQWKLSVSGDVTNTFTATVDELASEQAVQQTMICTCGGNPAGGRATITAAVKGIPISYLVQRAGAKGDANTITFISSDGTTESMPLAYAVGHHGVLSYEINGEDLSASVGGNNQLWLAGTSANYFIRDVALIKISSEENPPSNPGEGMSYPNSPNAGITSAAID